MHISKAATWKGLKSKGLNLQEGKHGNFHHRFRQYRGVSFGCKYHGTVLVENRLYATLTLSILEILRISYIEEFYSRNSASILKKNLCHVSVTKCY